MKKDHRSQKASMKPEIKIKIDLDTENQAKNTKTENFDQNKFFKEIDYIHSF